MKKTIFTGFAPNLTREATIIACKFLFFPWLWTKWNGDFDYVKKVEYWLQKYFNVPYAKTIDSGRSALLLSLKALGVKPDDEILVQAFTCLVVINAITTLGAKPVYIDIERGYGMDPNDLEKKITQKTKIIILQHTFGVPAKIKEIKDIAKNHNLSIIEDCAHALGAEYNGKKLGTFGDLAIISFGSDKMISCARGGAIIANSNETANLLKPLVNNLNKPPVLRTFQHLMHFPIFAISKPLYHVGVGKGILWLAAKFRVINRIIYDEEKKSLPMKNYPSKLSNALAKILLCQVEILDDIVLHRKYIAQKYASEIKNKKIVLPLSEIGDERIVDASMLRYPILAEHPYQLYLWAKKSQIILGNWYYTIVNPLPIDSSTIQYKFGSCPVAERIAKQSVNLPTDICIKEEELKKIIDCLNAYQA